MRADLQESLGQNLLEWLTKSIFDILHPLLRGGHTVLTQAYRFRYMIRYNRNMLLAPLNQTMIAENNR